MLTQITTRSAETIMHQENLSGEYWLQIEKERVVVYCREEAGDTKFHCDPVEFGAGFEPLVMGPVKILKVFVRTVGGGDWCYYGARITWKDANSDLKYFTKSGTQPRIGKIEEEWLPYEEAIKELVAADAARLKETYNRIVEAEEAFPEIPQRLTEEQVTAVVQDLNRLRPTYGDGEWSKEFVQEVYAGKRTSKNRKNEEIVAETIRRIIYAETE